MNTWQDISTAPLDAPVLVTDGENVYLGRIEKYPDLKAFAGTSLQDGHRFNTYAMAPCLTGWQPAPDTFAADNNVGATDVPETDVGKSTMDKCDPGYTITVCGHEVDPCAYEEIETHYNCTVHVLRCNECGHIEIEWEENDED